MRISNFNPNAKFTPSQRRRFKILLQGDIESIFATEATREAGRRFAEILLVNIINLDGIAIELSKDPKGVFGINQVMRKTLRSFKNDKGEKVYYKFTKHVISTIIQYLKDIDYIVSEGRETVDKLDKNGNIIGSTCKVGTTYYEGTELYRLTTSPKGTKLCKDCKKDLPTSEFYTNGNKCKLCIVKVNNPTGEICKFTGLPHVPHTVSEDGDSLPTNQVL